MVGHSLQRRRYQPSPTRARQPTPTKRRLPSRYRYRFPSPKSPRDVIDLVPRMGLEMDLMMSSAGKRVKAWQKGKGKESKAGDEMDISKEDKDGEMKDVVGEQEEDDRPQGIRVIVRGVLSCWIWINWRQRTEDHRGGDGGEHDMDVEGQGNVETVPVVERLVCYGLGERVRTSYGQEHYRPLTISSISTGTAAHARTIGALRIPMDHAPRNGDSPLIGIPYLFILPFPSTRALESRRNPLLARILPKPIHRALRIQLLPSDRLVQSLACTSHLESLESGCRWTWTWRAD